MTRPIEIINGQRHCKYCNESFPLDHFYVLPHRGRNRPRFICKIQNHNVTREYYRNMKQDEHKYKKYLRRCRHKQREYTFRNRWRAYRAYDKRIFGESDNLLEFNDAKLLMAKDCNYCGRIPAAGLDRTDNTQGHIQTNVVPCCKFCNILLMDMPYDAKLCIGKGIRKARLTGLLDNYTMPFLRNKVKNDDE